MQELWYNYLKVNKKGVTVYMVYLVTGCFIVLDFITGLIKALKQKNYSSTVMREGLFHKCASIIWIVFGTLVDYTQGYLDLGNTIPVCISICTYIVIMECGSIIENLGSINPEIVPVKVRQHFAKLNQQERGE